MDEVERAQAKHWQEEGHKDWDVCCYSEGWQAREQAQREAGCEDCAEFIDRIHDLRNLYGFHGPDVEARERGRILAERDRALAEVGRLEAEKEAILGTFQGYLEIQHGQGMTLEELRAALQPRGEGEQP